VHQFRVAFGLGRPRRRAAHQRQGIGTAVIRALIAEYPDRRLVAFSEDADQFWASLGWARFVNADSSEVFRPLFIQPRSSD
jgi:GNAT superfamily N-acetyltransferase